MFTCSSEISEGKKSYILLQFPRGKGIELKMFFFFLAFGTFGRRRIYQTTYSKCEPPTPTPSPSPPPTSSSSSSPPHTSSSNSSPPPTPSSSSSSPISSSFSSSPPPTSSSSSSPPPTPSSSSSPPPTPFCSSSPPPTPSSSSSPPPTPFSSSSPPPTPSSRSPPPAPSSSSSPPPAPSSSSPPPIYIVLPSVWAWFLPPHGSAGRSSVRPCHGATARVVFTLSNLFTAPHCFPGFGGTRRTGLGLRARATRFSLFCSVLRPYRKQLTRPGFVNCSFDSLLVQGCVFCLSSTDLV
jgi:hypothetical protein